MKNNASKKPVKIEEGEWYYKGCFIQKQDHPLLRRFIVFQDTKKQKIVGGCFCFNEAKKLCVENEVINPELGLDSFSA